jgi:acyl carrier protein phosphodiesterase
VSIEEDQVGIWPDLDRRLDHGFALTVHRQALAQLEAKHAQPPKPARFRALRPYILANDRLVSYAELGQQLGMTANHVSKEVFDLRQQYLRTFRQVVTQTANGESVDEEMRYLIELLAHWGAES